MTASLATELNFALQATDKLAAFPAELKTLPRWVTWKYETRDLKATKVLYDPRTNRRAKSTDPSTWASYEVAISAGATRGYAGVGCVLAPPYAAIDLDKCRNSATGEVEPWATEILSELNSYTELSPSGCGFHIWINGVVPPGGNKKGRIEMYSGGRYLTVTGNHFPGTPLTIEFRDLRALHARVFMGKSEPKTSLTDAGDLQGHYKSDSEADFALCLRLAEEHVGDAGKMDAAFRASALLRPKWDEKRGDKTYGEITINKAIERWLNNGSLSIIVEDESEMPTLPVYPVEALDGDYIGDLTRILTDGTSIPPQFVRENIKCILGAVIDGRAGFPGQEDIHTRHYTINVSLYPRTVKGESWKRTGDCPSGVLSSLLSEKAIKVIDGGLFGSGEYMAKSLCELEMDRTSPSRILARFDEMAEPFEKAKATGSTLESKLLQLYERNSVSSGSFKNGEHQVKDTHLSLSGDFTRDGFLKTFEGRGSGGSGFLARCALSFADRILHVGDWRELNNIAITKLVTEVECCADTVINYPLLAPEDRLIPEECDEARDLRWDFFERLRKEDPRYIPELEAHFKRDLLMRVLFSKDTQIDAARTQKSIAWTLHQLDLRKELWPEDAGGPVERMEQKIVKALNGKGTLSEKRLIDFCNVRRGGSGGHEAFNRAMRALTSSHQIAVIGKSQRGAPVYALTE